MRRPWELAHMQQTRGAPRVYVPFSLPDTSAATFAVLELVGFSSSPASSQSSLSPSLSTSLQPAAPSLCGHSQLHLPPIQSFHAPNSASHSVKLLTDSSITNHTESSTTCLKILPVSTTQVVDGAAPSSPPRIISKKPVLVQTHIKENVVHTTSLNFKDVVQQLTGASSNDKDIITATVRPNKLAAMPPAMPSGKAAANKILDALSVKVDASKGFKKVPSKLQERRKSLHNLEKLCTNKSLTLRTTTSTSPLSPSPVTPLASFFEKFCTAITPSASQSSDRSSGVSSPEPLFPESDSSNTNLIVPYTSRTSEQCMTSEGSANALSKLEQYASLMESLRGPALLSLFPESPL